MSGSRTKTGCWTCRLRRKKCDEAKPICSNCASRSVECYGYGQKPSWMVDKESWQQVLDSAEARPIRNAAEKAYSRRRQENIPPVPWSSSVHVQSLRELARPPDFSLDRTWSNCTQPLRDCSYTPNFQRIQTFLDLIFPLQWGFFNLSRQPDRKWLFNTIVASEPMYHTSLALCTSFESGVRAGATNGRCDVTPEVQKSRLLAIQGLQPYIAEMHQDKLDMKSLQNSVHSLAIILLLASLEIYGETEGLWEFHQNAAGTVLDMIETRITISDPKHSELGFIERLLRNSTSSFENRALEFFVATFAWTDILAEAAHGLTYSKPRKFEYLPLLRSNLLDLRSIMGCQNLVMIAIKDVSILSFSTGQSQQFNQVEAAEALTVRIQDVIQESSSALSHSPVGLVADSNRVTLLHAYAALVYLQTVLAHEGLQNTSDMQEIITKCLEALEILPCQLFIRVCWPYTVAGCMAHESLHSRFREVLRRVEQAGHVLGFTWKGLLVMEECWRLRRDNPGSVWCWRTTMQHMNARILLI